MTPETRIDPGTLPEAFATVGLRLLRVGRFREAQKFYEAAVEEDGQRADGWFGLGAALLSLGKLRDGARALVKGLSLEPDFPIDALLIETDLQPSLLFNVAELLVADESAPARACAVAAVRRCLLHPCPPLNAQARGVSLLQRLGIEDESPAADEVEPVVDVPPVRTEQPPVRRTAVVLQGVAFCFIVALVGFLCWSLYTAKKTERLTREAVAHYAQAVQATASHRDATSLYIDAFRELADAAALDGDDIKASFLVATCGQDILERTRRGQIHPSREALDELKAATANARAELAKLDPEGSRVKQLEAEGGLSGLRING